MTNPSLNASPIKEETACNCTRNSDNALRAAAELALTQMEQLESMFSDDPEFMEALTALRAVH